MNATQPIPKTIAQQMAARIEVARIAEPYIAQGVAILSVCLPIMEVSHQDGHVLIKTSYPPEVQAALDRIEALCKDAVGRYLRREGFVLPDQEP